MQYTLSFAQLDENNVVINVLVLNNEDCVDEDGNESAEFDDASLSASPSWVQTQLKQTNLPQHEGQIRRCRLHLRPTSLDAFILPKPYPTWTLWRSTRQQIGTHPQRADPSDENSLYAWHEDTLTWVEQDIS